MTCQSWHLGADTGFLVSSDPAPPSAPTVPRPTRCLRRPLLASQAAVPRSLVLDVPLRSSPRGLQGAPNIRPFSFPLGPWPVLK